jgi:hypothetical protein
MISFELDLICGGIDREDSIEERAFSLLNHSNTCPADIRPTFMQ